MRKLVFVTLFVLAACGSNPASPTPAPTLVPSSTPPPQQVRGAYDNLPSGINAQGFPTLGADNAPIQVMEYSSYDSSASQLAHTEIFPALLPRIEANEIQYIFVPLSGTGTAPNGIGAARGALCAGEQNAYWEYHDQLFMLLQEQGDDAYTGANLLNITDQLGLNREVWNTCIAGDSTTATLRNASSTTMELESYSGTPTILINGNYVLNDIISINNIIDQMIDRVDENGVVAPLPTVTISPENIAEEVILDFESEATFEAPIDLTLPQGWQLTLDDTLLLQDIDAIRTIPYRVYKGPVDGGIGTIVLLWGFPNITTGNPMEAELGIATPTPNLWTDGLRLLRLAIVEPGCNVGTDLQREYPLGAVTGTGTQWSAVDCPETPPTRGWFVGIQQNKLNFVFYTYIDPIDPDQVTDSERNARLQIQSILDTVVFRPIE